MILKSRGLYILAFFVLCPIYLLLLCKLTDVELVHVLDGNGSDYILSAGVSSNKTFALSSIIFARKPQAQNNI
jgi:hypothetical protein